MITNEQDFSENILENNIFNNSNNTFCLLQQMNIDKDEKFFIFGIKFDDIFIPAIKNRESEKLKIKNFVYEKTYLFISYEPLCKLFEAIFHFILNTKKINFWKYIPDFDTLKEKNNITNFNKYNNEENVRIIILKIIIVKNY